MNATKTASWIIGAGLHGLIIATALGAFGVIFLPGAAADPLGNIIQTNGGCIVNVSGSCAGNCTINAGTCGTNGNCVINTGACYTAHCIVNTGSC